MLVSDSCVQKYTVHAIKGEKSFHGLYSKILAKHLCCEECFSKGIGNIGYLDCLIELEIGKKKKNEHCKYREQNLIKVLEKHNFSCIIRNDGSECAILNLLVK
jgi:hypothetical protein